MKSKTLTKKSLIVSCIMAFVVLSLGWAALGMMRERRRPDTLFLRDNWEISMGGKTFYNVSLSEFSMAPPEKGSTLGMRTYITDDKFSEGYTALLLVYLCSVEAYIDGKEIYSFGTYEVKNDVFLGSGYHFLTLPADCYGKELYIHLVFNEPNAITSIPPLMCNRTDQALRIYANNNILSFFTNTFIMLFGIILFVVGVLVRPYNRTYLRLILIGLFAFLVGNWSNCSIKIYEVFSMNLNHFSIMEYFSLYCAPLPIETYIYVMRRLDGGWRPKAILGATIVSYLFVVATCILHFTNIIRAPQMLLPFHLIISVCMVIIIVSGVVFIKRDSLSDSIVMVGVIVLGASVALELIRFNLQKYVFTNNLIMMDNSFLPVGTLIFVILLITSYLLSLYDMISTNAEKDALMKLAYHDPLTGLYNRAKSQEVFAELNGQDDEVALVNFDVNGLKTVNDTFGHDEGDVLLRTVAEIIRSSFGTVGTFYRLSGDEFLAIVGKGGVLNLDQIMQRFERSCRDASKNSKYVISVSYGTAVRKKGEKISLNTLYNEADEKMYDMKVKSEYSRRSVEKRMITMEEVAGGKASSSIKQDVDLDN